MRELIFVAIGGALGAVSRYLVGLGAIRWLGQEFPYGTLIVNVIGCFFLGLLWQLTSEWKPQPQELPLYTTLREGLSIGYLGALTTFSTFSVETIRRMELGQWQIAGGNVVANIVLGLFAAWVGMRLAQLW